MNIHALIRELAQEEMRAIQRPFLAPCVAGGTVRTRIAGIIHTFSVQPSDYEGWALFQPGNFSEARVEQDASLPMIDRYLNLFPAFRFRLVCKLKGRSWLAFPVENRDVMRRAGAAGPQIVHLVANGELFQQIIVRWDGSSFWYHELDRRADPVIEDRLRIAIQKYCAPEDLHISGMTPEDRNAYAVVWSRMKKERERAVEAMDAGRLRAALEQGGGTLSGFSDRESYWLVRWETSDGEQHTSAIEKTDLTVMGAGICLEDTDRAFDLQSLVAVVENRPDWMR